MLADVTKPHGTGLPPDSLVLSYLHGGRFRYRPGEVLGPRLLTDYELVLILEGDVVYCCDGVEHELNPGSFVLGRPGSEEIYRWDPKHATYHAFIHFDIEHAPSDWPEEGNWPRVRQKPDPATAPLFRHVLRHVGEHPDWPVQRPGRAECRLMETLIDVLLETHLPDEGRLERDRPEPVRRALKWMKLRLEVIPVAPVTLTDLAREASVTQKHLCRLFTRSLGHTPMQTFNLLRLQYAMALLARSNLSVKEVAERCGYDDPLYFSRSFSKAFGQAPSRARNGLREGKPPPPNPLPADIMPRLYW